MMELKLIFLGVFLVLLASSGDAKASITQPHNLTDICNIINDNCNCTSTPITGKPNIVCVFGKGLKEKSQTLLQDRPSSERHREGNVIGNLDISHSALSSLSDNFLAGVTTVHTLTAQHCQLMRLPAALLAVQSIRVLDLSHNNFTTFSLDTLAKQGVRQLCVGSNSIEKLLVTGQHPNRLHTLDASDNKLSQLPLTSWQKLKDVRISNNAFSTLPALPGPSQIRGLDASGNSLSEFPTDFLRMTPEIKKLNLARNAIHLPSTALPRDLNLTRLRHLDLSGNRIQQVSPGLLANFLQLQVLDLSHNQLTHLLHDHDLFPQHTSRLLSLHLSHNALVLVHPTTFHHLHRLRDLDLSSNPGLGKTGVSHISFPEHLTSLDLRNCSLQQVHYCQLSQLHDLAMLRLSHNPLMCTCDLYNLHKWYRNPDRSKQANNSQADWRCLTDDEEIAVSVMQQPCSEFIHCLSADPTETVPDVQMSVEVIHAEHNLITSWTVSNSSQQMHGFRVFCTTHGVEDGMGAVEGAIHVSPVLGVALRSYALTNIEAEQSYTVCVDVLRNETLVVKRVCQSVKGAVPNAIVGILAGIIFLVPCIVFVIFIFVKDRSMQLNNLAYFVDIPMTDINHDHGESQCLIRNAHENESHQMHKSECGVIQSRHPADTTDGCGAEKYTTDTQMIARKTIGTQTNASDHDFNSQVLQYTDSPNEPLFWQNADGTSSTERTNTGASNFTTTHGSNISSDNRDMMVEDLNLPSLPPSSQGEGQTYDPLPDLDHLVAELQSMIDNGSK